MFLPPQSFEYFVFCISAGDGVDITLRIARLDSTHDPKGHRMRDTALADWLGRAAPDIVVSPRGKPQLLPPLCQFSFSRSEPFAAMAITADKAIGIDIETRACDATATEVATACMSPAELADWQVLDPPARTQRFLSTWRIKEAILKATGDGLLCDPRGIELEFREGIARIIHLPNHYPRPSVWRIGEFVPPSPLPTLAWAVYPEG